MNIEKDERWAKQFGDFSEGLVMYLLGQLKNMSVALVDHVGADIFAVNRKNNEQRYAISVKGRNIPPNESKSYNFSKYNIDKLVETSEAFGMEPTIALVFVDEQEVVKKIRVFVFTLRNILKLCDDNSVNFANRTDENGIRLRFTESQRTHHLSDIKKCQYIDYTELAFESFKPEISI